MAKRQKYKSLLDKSLAAAVSAIEIYNKPDFKYREETFSILMVNAWELLLKAKILKDGKNQMKSIYVPAKTTTRDNRKIKRFFPKKNRSGNPMTIDIYAAINRATVDNVLKGNIEALVEIRDNASHFANPEKLFQKKVLEVGTATLRSYVAVHKEWFNEDLSRYNFYLMPLSFFHPFEFESQSINKVDKQLKNLLAYIKRKEKKYPSDELRPHNIGLALETRFVKSTAPTAMTVRYTDDPGAVPVRIEEEQVFKTKFPLSFKGLVKKCKERYSDFTTNRKFFNAKKILEAVPEHKYARPRYLDIENKKGMKMYYSPEILVAFDTYYTKK
jgi:hypothetical protein